MGTEDHNLAYPSPSLASLHYDHMLFYFANILRMYCLDEESVEDLPILFGPNADAKVNDYSCIHSLLVEINSELIIYIFLISLYFRRSYGYLTFGIFQSFSQNVYE